MNFVLAIKNRTTAAPTIRNVTLSNAAAKPPYPLANGLPITANGQLVSLVTIKDGTALSDSRFDVVFDSTPVAEARGSVTVQFGLATLAPNGRVEPFFGAQPLVPGVSVDVDYIPLISEGYCIGLLTLDFIGRS